MELKKIFILLLIIRTKFKKDESQKSVKMQNKICNNKTLFFVINIIFTCYGTINPNSKHKKAFKLLLVIKAKFERDKSKKFIKIQNKSELFLYSQFAF